MKAIFFIVKILIIVYMFFEGLWKKLFRKMEPKKWTTHGEYYDKHKNDSKKQIIREICRIAGLINENAGGVDREYYNELRNQGKKTLLKTLCVLNIAYTHKVTGKKATVKNEV